MEVKRDGILKRFFLAEKIPFSDKRDVNWQSIKWTCALFLAGFVVAALTTSSPPETEENAAVTTQDSNKNGALENAVGFQTHQEYSAEYSANNYRQSVATPKNREATMVLLRDGVDLRTKLPPGTRVRIRLLDTAVVSSEPVPLIGVAIEDVLQENGIAIARGAKVFGEASLADSDDLVIVNWTSIQLLDGSERPFLANGLDMSGQNGISGSVKSKRVQNIVGNTLSKFIGAYADGSVQRGMLGSSLGGAKNGLRSALSETAKDQAENYANQMKKEKRWIELSQGTELFAVLNKPFLFREPGSYGK